MGFLSNSFRSNYTLDSPSRIRSVSASSHIKSSAASQRKLEERSCHISPKSQEAG